MEATKPRQTHLVASGQGKAQRDIFEAVSIPLRYYSQIVPDWGGLSGEHPWL